MTVDVRHARRILRRHHKLAACSFTLSTMMAAPNWTSIVRERRVLTRVHVATIPHGRLRAREGCLASSPFAAPSIPPPRVVVHVDTHPIQIPSMLPPVLGRHHFGSHTLQLLQYLGVGLVDAMGLLLAVLLVQRVAAVLGVLHRLTLLVEAFVGRAVSLHYRYDVDRVNTTG